MTDLQESPAWSTQWCILAKSVLKAAMLCADEKKAESTDGWRCSCSTSKNQGYLDCAKR